MRRSSPVQPRSKAAAKAAAKAHLAKRRSRPPPPAPESESCRTFSDVKMHILFQFRRLDTNRDGLVDLKELGELLQNLNSTVWTPERIDELMKVIDTDGDGNIRFAEFVEWAFSSSKDKDTENRFASALGRLPSFTFESHGYDFWKVVHLKGVSVRASPETTSDKIGAKQHGAFLIGKPVGDWISLVGEPGFMLIQSPSNKLLEKQQIEQLLALDNPDALAVVQAFSMELCRTNSYMHHGFENPRGRSCWLSTFFQSLWHSRVFHVLFDFVVWPLPPQGPGSATDALRETWELYERTMTIGAPVPVDALVEAWGDGYGDCAEAFGRIQDEPALKPLAELFAMVPVALFETKPTPKALLDSVSEMHVDNAPLIALDLMFPEDMESDSILATTLALMPCGEACESVGMELGDHHCLVAMVCYVLNYMHYVVFCRRQCDKQCWLLYNDIPNIKADWGRLSEFYGWDAVAQECARLELQPKVLLYESLEKVHDAVGKSDGPLRTSLGTTIVTLPPS